MRLTRESQSIREGSARHVDYGYDQAANVLTLTYPSGTTIATSYDALGRGDVLKRDGKQIADYDYLGQRLKALTFETGTDDVQLTQTFDGVGRLTRMTYAQTGNTGLPDFSYGFDAASNITRKGFEHRSGAPSEDYGYDTLHRLTRTTFGQRTAIPYEGFVYDHLGNHLVQDDNGTTVAGLFNAVNEQTKRGTTALSHDLRGNLTADDTSGGRVYLYDRQNLLTRVEDGSSNRIASYAYDALGRRIEKDVQGGTVTEFYWNGQQLVEETDASGTVQRKYLWAPSPGRGGYIDDLVQFIDRTGGSETARYAARHHNFNIVALINSDGNIEERYDYNPYGKRFVLDADYSDDVDGVSDFGLSFGHQGLYHDEETGLIYNRARMLSPGCGRYIQRDPLGYVDGMSVYEYVKSSPLLRLDSSGLNSGVDCCGGKEYSKHAAECCGDAEKGEIYGPPVEMCCGDKVERTSWWKGDRCCQNGIIGTWQEQHEILGMSMAQCLQAYKHAGNTFNSVILGVGGGYSLAILKAGIHQSVWGGVLLGLLPPVQDFVTGQYYCSRLVCHPD